MATQWRPILHTDQDYLDRFVSIMRSMAPLFRALKVSQLAKWLDPNDGGTYAGSRVNAYAWFARPADMNVASRMQTVFLGYQQTAAAEPEVLMVGWAPAQRPNNPTVLDTAVQSLLEVGHDWLLSLQPNGSLNILQGVQCKDVPNEAGRILKDHFFWRAAIEPLPVGSPRQVKLLSENDLGDAFHWRAEVS